MSKILFLLCTLVTSLCCFTSIHGITAKAETEDYVAESYLIEISQTESMLPVPNVPEGWVYKITLKSGETVLGEGISKYSFTQTGEYTLVYEFRKNGSLTEFVTETAVLRVADVNKPVIITPDGYEEEYFIGDELTIQTAQVEDDVDTNLTATAELCLGNEKLSVQDGKYVFTEAGRYTLTYKAMDSAGNVGLLTYEFTVSVKPQDNEEPKGCSGGCSSVVGGMAGSLGGMAICVLLSINKKSKTKIKNKEKNNEN